MLVTNHAGEAASGPAVLAVLVSPVLADPHINADGAFATSLIGPTNWIYALEATTNFLDWLELSRLTNTGQLTPLVDADATNHPGRFYRVRVTQ